jgi:hypothetical protein
MNVDQNEDVLLEVEIEGHALRVTPTMLEQIRDFAGDEGEQIVDWMFRIINTWAKEITDRADRIQDSGASDFRTTISCEELGTSIADACIILLNDNVPHMIEEAENELGKWFDNTASNRQYHNKFHLELSALVFVVSRFAISIFGPDDASERSRIFASFDKATHQALTEQFFDLTNRRIECYVECLRENWGGEYLGSRLADRFDHFVLGGEDFVHEPRKVCGLFEMWPRATAAIGALGIVFHLCQSMFERTQLA